MGDLRIDRQSVNKENLENLGKENQDSQKVKSALAECNAPITFVSDGSSKGISGRIGEVRENMDQGPEITTLGCAYSGWGNSGGSCTHAGWGN